MPIVSFSEESCARSDVNGKVKGRYQARFDLIILVGEEMIKEQFIEYLQYNNENSHPKHSCAVKLLETLSANKSADEQKEFLMNLLKDFMVYYGYGTVDCPKSNVSRESDKTKCFMIKKG